MGAPVVPDSPLQVGDPPRSCQQGMWEEDRGRAASWRFVLPHSLLLAEIPNSKGQVPCYCVRLKQNKGKTGLVLTPLRFMAFWAVLAPKSTQSERWRPSRAQS